MKFVNYKNMKYLNKCKADLNVPESQYFYISFIFWWERTVDVGHAQWYSVFTPSSTPRITPGNA